MNTKQFISRSLTLVMAAACALTIDAQVTKFSGVEPEPGMIPPHPTRLPEVVIPAFPGA